MSLASTDERDLILPLFSGMREQPLWDSFLRRLLARTGSQRICMLVTTTAPARRVVIERTLLSPNTERRDAVDMIAFTDDILLGYGSPRPNRVYSLEELLIHGESETGVRQRKAMAEAGVAHARFIRIPAGEHSIWIFLLHDRQEFRAADSVLLSALAPHVALAFAILLESDTLRLRAAMAEDALAMIGVGQAALDDEGRIVVGDALGTAEIDGSAGSRALRAACQALAGGPATAREVVHIQQREGKDAVLRPAPPIAAGLAGLAAAVALVRRPPPNRQTGAARVVAATLGLSTREAALAEAMSRGRSILEAGAELQLTPETARNYSKRIYAKIGATGQADLVRMVLAGLAPFS